jgi:uncharacterized membrane protein YecN with MAPEG domain
LECREVTPAQVGFPGARLIARLQRRVRRHGQKSTETVFLISSLTPEQLDARGWLKLKRGYWIIESRLHHALDVSLDEDRSRVRQPNAALVLGLFRRLVVSVAQAAIAKAQTQKTRWTVRRYQQRFAHRDGGPQRLRALIFAHSPNSWYLPT